MAHTYQLFRLVIKPAYYVGIQSTVKPNETVITLIKLDSLCFPGQGAYWLLRCEIQYIIFGFICQISKPLLYTYPINLTPTFSSVNHEFYLIDKDTSKYVINQIHQNW